MAFLLKVRWEIKPGMQNQFCQSEKALAEVMLNHPWRDLLSRRLPQARVERVGGDLRQ